MNEEQPYISLKWIMNNIVLIGGYCPVCFGDHINFNDTLAPSCKCGWEGNMVDLLSKEEAMARKRTKLIDDILK